MLPLLPEEVRSLSFEAFGSKAFIDGSLLTGSSSLSAFIDSGRSILNVLSMWYPSSTEEIAYCLYSETNIENG